MGMLYAALYHSFSLGRKMVAPAFRVILRPLEGVGVPPSRVYAPLSVSPFPWPLFSQFAKRTVSYQVTKLTGWFPSPEMVLYLLPLALPAL
jgi:hypothetical protein